MATPANIPESQRLWQSIRRKKEAELWRTKKRNLAATARELSCDVGTVRGWRDKYGWVAWADAADAELGERVGKDYESAVQKHLRETESLIGGARAIIGQAEHDILGRLRAQKSVDLLEVRMLASALKSLVDAGAIHFNLKTLNINHSGELAVKTDLEEIKRRLAPKLAELTVIEYAGSRKRKAG